MPFYTSTDTSLTGVKCFFFSPCGPQENKSAATWADNRDFNLNQGVCAQRNIQPNPLFFPSLAGHLAEHDDGRRDCYPPFWWLSAQAPKKPCLYSGQLKQDNKTVEVDVKVDEMRVCECDAVVLPDIQQTVADLFFLLLFLIFKLCWCLTKPTTSVQFWPFNYWRLLN